MMHRSLVLLTLAAAVAVAGCDDGTTSPRHRQSVIEILPESASTTAFSRGDTIRLSARRLTTAGLPIEHDTAVRFIWASSDTTMLIVDSTGLAEIVGLGSASVTVRIADSRSPAVPSATDTAAAAVQLTAAPKVVHEGPVAMMAVAYPWHECVLLVGGRAECRGRNHQGQLGIGVVSESVPEWSPVSGGLGFSTLSTSYFHSCGFGQDGRPYCWGSNGFRNLDMELDVRRMAVPVEFGEDYQWLSIEAGADSRTCGITVDHVPMCAGRNGWGQNGHTLEWQASLREWGTGYKAAVIRTNLYRTCIIDLEGKLHCTSSNPAGTIDRIAGTSALVTIDIGAHHGCGLTASGAAFCWGANGMGQLGTGDLTSSMLSLRPVAGGHVFTSISTLHETSCGLTVEGEVWCWGLTYRRTYTVFSTVPVRVPTVSGAKQVALSERGPCIIDAGDRLVCW